MGKLPYTVRAQDQTDATSSSVHGSVREASKAALAFRNRGYEKVWIEDANGDPVGEDSPEF